MPSETWLRSPCKSANTRPQMTGFHLWRTGLWFRICGYGLAVSRDPTLFSERYGYRKIVRMFGWKVELLNP